MSVCYRRNGTSLLCAGVAARMAYASEANLLAFSKRSGAVDVVLRINTCEI